MTPVERTILSVLGMLAERKYEAAIDELDMALGDDNSPQDRWQLLDLKAEALTRASQPEAALAVYHVLQSEGGVEQSGRWMGLVRLLNSMGFAEEAMSVAFVFESRAVARTEESPTNVELAFWGLSAIASIGSFDPSTTPTHRLEQLKSWALKLADVAGIVLPEATLQGSVGDLIAVVSRTFSEGAQRFQAMMRGLHPSEGESEVEVMTRFAQLETVPFFRVAAMHQLSLHSQP